MQCAVKIPELSTIYVVTMLEEYLKPSDGVEIVKDAWVETPMNIAEWPDGEERPPVRTLGVSRTDPKHFREFKHANELEKDGFEPTGMSYGGIYSPSQWERLAERIPAMKAFEAIKGHDRPGAMDEALRSIRAAR